MDNFWQAHPIIKRADGSYVIQIKLGENIYPYHVLDATEFVDIFTQVNEYTINNPSQVEPEQTIAL